MVSNSLISVIVPVYNVEQYIDVCLDSILKQTYSNIEVIIVNDGSTDNSLKVCEKYLSDKRVKIITKTNGGLSSARNEGIKHANGEFYLFVDSDDYYFSKSAIEILYELLISNNADIACCSWTSSEKKINKKYKTRIFTPEEGISRLLDTRGVKCFAWNKIYRKFLFDDIKFPEGELFEDIKTQFQLFSKSKKIVYYNCPLYFYRLRFNSICNSPYTKRNVDLVNAIDYIMDNVKNNKYVEKRLNVGYSYYFLTFINKAIIAHARIDKYEKKLRVHIKHNLSDILISDSVDIKRKCMLILYFMTPSIYKKLYLLSQKIE